MGRPTKKEQAATEQLVREFDVGQYEGCADLPLMNWYFLLEDRAWMYRASQSEAGPWLRHADKLDDALLCGPLKYGEHGRYDGSFTLDASKPVADTQVCEVMYNAHIMRQAAPGLARGVETFIKDMEEFLYSERPKGMELPFFEVELSSESGYQHHTTERAQLTVSMAATDEVLRSSFNAWLKAARARKKHPESHKLNRSVWEEKRVLPFIDLKIIASYRGVDLTQDAICDALWPGLKKDKQSTAANLKVRAQELLSLSCRDAILIAARETKG